MDRVLSYLRSLKDPMKLIQLLMIIGGLGVAYTLLAAVQKPSELRRSEDEPVYVVGEMESFERTFPPQGLPSLKLEGPDGPVNLTGYADGRPLVVNLWATWCAPCIEELPSLAALQEQLGDEVRVLAVAQEGGDGSRQRAMLERVGAEDLELLLDPRLSYGRSVSDELSLPITILYDSRGREVGRVTKPADWASPEAVRLVRAVGQGALPR
ncbi:TlpA family protein disulfide reductase [Parvularcula lutaonensis]|uniref:TlpA family protein disulfide reductase n=1 Tax=Parvularcula lutaonensis TaxID=491923 RepID=A0ABV7MC50_9PROT|nr:TlpA disulfide reductase family protein [Parvularcula lutaonensis]GGY37556.1 hypothetical protein GCM10007148_02290 [Parvularcula lutaonensis]